MSQWLNSLLNQDASKAVDAETGVLLALMLAFCIGHVIGWVYMWTHSGLSYSQTFVSSLVVLPVLVALVMSLMTGDIVVAFGLMAVVGVVRFRNVLKDTRDTSFVLWAIVQGMAVGTLRFSTAVVGCGVVALIFLYLRMTSIGGRHRYDVVLSLHLDRHDFLGTLRQILRRHSVNVQLASQHDLPDDSSDLSYRLLLRDPRRTHELVSELEAAGGIGRVSLYHKAEESEL